MVVVNLWVGRPLVRTLNARCHLLTLKFLFTQVEYLALDVRTLHSFQASQSLGTTMVSPIMSTIRMSLLHLMTNPNLIKMESMITIKA